MTDYKIFEIANVLLQKGGFLPTVRLAYKTLGTLNARRDNAVLVPTWYTGTHNDNEAFLIGTERALNPDKYFIILPNLLANGLSSSPSNTPSPFEGGRFPKITLYDNVKLQQKLVREELGVERLKLVTGFSMGASANLPEPTKPKFKLTRPSTRSRASPTTPSIRTLPNTASPFPFEP